MNWFAVGMLGFSGVWCAYWLYWSRRVQRRHEAQLAAKTAEIGKLYHQLAINDALLQAAAEGGARLRARAHLYLFSAPRDTRPN